LEGYLQTSQQDNQTKQNQITNLNQDKINLQEQITNLTQNQTENTRRIGELETTRVNLQTELNQANGNLARQRTVLERLLADREENNNYNLEEFKT
jgi:chromosome segregation ATPase